LFNESKHGILYTLLVAAFKVKNGALSIKELSKPLGVLCKTYSITALVLDEGQDIDKGYIIAVNHGENQGLNKHDLTLTAGL